GEELTGQDRPVELPGGEDTLRHRVGCGGPSIRCSSSQMAAQTVREKGTSTKGTVAFKATAKTVRPVHGTSGQVSRMPPRAATKKRISMTPRLTMIQPIATTPSGLKTNSKNEHKSGVANQQ